MANSLEKTKGTEEAWEDGILGTDATYAEIFDLVDDDALDDAMCLHAISIRLKKSLIEELKLVAQFHGLGYQPLMKQILQRFVDAEMKIILKQHADDFYKKMPLLKLLKRIQRLHSLGC